MIARLLRGRLRSLSIKVRKAVACFLIDVGWTGAGVALFPAVQGGGDWVTGAGFKITVPGLNGGSQVDDPAGIDLGEYGIWFGIKQTLGGATPLFGAPDRLRSIKVIVPGDMDVTVATAGDALQTITLRAPDGSTKTYNGKIVGVTGPNLMANSTDGNQKTVTIQTDGED